MLSPVLQDLAQHALHVNTLLHLTTHWRHDGPAKRNYVLSMMRRRLWDTLWGSECVVGSAVKHKGIEYV